MSKVQILRAFVNQRLTAAAEEIFGLFERTIAEYEEEIDRQRGLLQDANRSETQRTRAVFPANVKTFMVIKEVPPENQQDPEPPHIKERSSSLDQEDPEPPHIKERSFSLDQQDPEPPHIKERSSSLDQEDPEPPHIKEEQEELWTSQEGEQLQGLEEADIKFPVKSEDDEEEAQSSLLHHRHTEQMETEADGEDCGGPEPARNSDPDRHLQPDNYKTSFSSETEDSNNGRREPQSGFNALRVSGSDLGCDVAKEYFSCSECGKIFGRKDHLLIHMKCHPGGKNFTCQFCCKKFTKNSNLTTHLRVHTGEKPFTCSVCNTSFSLRCTLVNHMRVHTGEKPFSCSVCSKRFSKKANLTTHMALHTEEKPFKCSVCDKRFTWHSQVKNHKCVVDGSR